MTPEDRKKWVDDYRRRHPECRLRRAQLEHVVDAAEKHKQAAKQVQKDALREAGHRASC